METMGHRRGKARFGLLAGTIALVFAVIAPPARSEVPVRFVRLDGFALRAPRPSSTRSVFCRSEGRTHETS